MTAVAPRDATEGAQARSSPYQGLVPFSEADAAWFFGRNDWRETIVDNLRAYRVSVLYGASGVGKSSLLDAGVVPRLRDEATSNLAQYGAPELAVLTFSDWSAGDPTAALQEAIGRAVETISPELARDPPTGTLADVLSAWGDRIGGSLRVVLDQFEEYFLYHAGDDGSDSFRDEFALALRRRDTPANFLLSIREDALAQLDRFEGRIPGLLDNLMRIEHLDRNAAREAIERPLEQWNRLHGEAALDVEIEPTLVEAVLDQVEAGKILVGDRAGAVDGDRLGKRIEAPFLQLVLTRVWAEEEELGSRRLRVATLEALGGADTIVRTHLDATMTVFPRRAQAVAARVFRYLVTPSGTKIAHRVGDLAEYSDVPRERLEPVLSELAGEARILRPVGDDAFEIYHDALANPILDWCARWQERQRRRRDRRRAGVLAIVGIFLALVAAAMVVLTLRARDAQNTARSRELAAQADLRLGSDPQEALASAVRAVDAAPTAQADEALRAAFGATNVRAVFRGNVTGVSFSPDGRRVVTDANDGPTRIWDARSGRQVGVLRRRNDWQYSHDGKLAVSRPTLKHALRVWDVRTGRQRCVLHGTATAGSVGFSPDGRRIVTGFDSDRLERLWDAHSCVLVAVLSRSVNNITFSPDNKIVASASAGGTLVLSDAHSGRRLRVLQNPVSVLRAVFSPDSRRVAAQLGALPEYNPPPQASVRTVPVWDVKSGRQVTVLRGHTDLVNSVAFSRDGQAVVTGSDDGTARVWDSRTGRERTVLRGHTGVVRSAAFSPDAKLVVTTSDDGTARVWDTPSGRDRAVLLGHTGDVRTATFSPNGRIVLTMSYDGTARLWEPHRGELRVLAGRETGAVELSPDTRLVANEEGLVIRVRDTRSGREVDRLHPPGRAYSLRFSPGADLLAVVGSPHMARLWDVRSGSLRAVLRGHTDIVNGVAFNADGARVVTGSFDGTARIWDTRTGAELSLLPRGGDFHSAAFSRDGAFLATVDGSGPAQVWDARSGRRLRALDSTTYLAAFSPDSALVVTSSFESEVWDARSGRRLSVQGGHTGVVNSVVFNPKGDLVGTASGDRTARIWYARTGKPLSVLRGHSGAVYSIAFNSDGTLAVTASSDGTARIWKVGSGRELGVLRAPAREVASAVFSPDDRRVVTVGSDGTTRVYRCEICGSLHDVLARAREQLARTQR